MDLWRTPLNSPPFSRIVLPTKAHDSSWIATGSPRGQGNFGTSHLALFTCLIHLTASTKVFLLSEYTFWSLPLRAMKRLKLARNSVDSRLGNKSKNKARVRLQAYSKTRFSLCFRSFSIHQRARVINANDLEMSLPFCPILWEVSLGRGRESLYLKSSTPVAVLHDSFRQPS